MSDIRYSQASTTFSSVITAGIIAMQMLHGTSAKYISDNNHEPLLQPSYSLGGNKPTYNKYSNAITGTYNSAPAGFEQSIGSFYARLLESQKPLGAEFEKVLYDNLWDLYES